MGKWLPYTKWFQKLWITEPLQNWLKEVICDDMKAYCRICYVQLRAP